MVGFGEKGRENYFHESNKKKQCIGISKFEAKYPMHISLFKEWKILKIKDILEVEICLLLHDFLKAKLPQSF